jgi:hypothetical protein
LTPNDRDFFTLIRYHWYYPNSSDPWYLYNITDNMARNNYYSNNYSPHLFIDGHHDAGSNTGTWSNAIMNESYDDAMVSIDLRGTFMPDSLAGYLHIDINVEQYVGLNNIKLRVALMENNIQRSSPNGTQIHHQTFRDMFPTTGGIGISLPEGERVSQNIRFTVPSPIVVENSQLVAFIQSDQNREIIQGARINISELEVTGIEDGGLVPRSLSLSQNYPNPFNAQTRIDFTTAGGLTTLGIYDITGSRVASICNGDLNSGSYSMVWDGCDQNGQPVSSGTYFYRLTDSSGQQTKRMTLLK